MRSEPRLAGLALSAMVALVVPSAARAGEGTATALRTSLLFDGRGQAFHDKTLVIENGRIGCILDVPPAHVPAYDLRGLTVLPGLIDTHVHLSSSLNPAGRASRAGLGSDTLGLATAANALATLRAGFTTLQCLSVAGDHQRFVWSVRDAIERGRLPGPRLLLSGAAIADHAAPARLREMVRERAAEGVDVVKVFAARSIRDGGCATLELAELEAICGEANAIGLPTAVHAHEDESIRRATVAGCTSIEHGVGASRATLEMMAASGTAFDPNIGLVIQNYLENRAAFAGIGNFTPAAFDVMEGVLPGYLELFRQAVAVRGLGIVLGTDAAAGAHGRNAEELVVRVRDGGQDAMEAVVSATSRAARVLRLDSLVGALEPGLEADIIALDGDPREDPTAFRRVVFVMRGGRIVVAPPGRPPATRDEEQDPRSSINPTSSTAPKEMTP